MNKTQSFSWVPPRIPNHPPVELLPLTGAWPTSETPRIASVPVFCTYASVAVRFSSVPVFQFFFPAAQLCGKMSKKLSQLKKTYQNLSHSHRLKVFSTLQRRENIEWKVFCLVAPNSKQQRQNAQEEAYCLFWSHFFRLDKKSWQNPDVCDVGHTFESVTMWDSHICHKTSQMLTNLVWLVQSLKPLFFRTHIIQIHVWRRPARDKFDLRWDWPPWEDLDSKAATLSIMPPALPSIYMSSRRYV